MRMGIPSPRPSWSAGLVPVLGAAVAAGLVPPGWAALGAALGGIAGMALVALLARETPEPVAAAKPRTLQPFEWLDGLPAPLLLIGASGGIVGATREAARLLGREVPAVHLSSVIRSPTVMAAVDAVLEGGAGERFAFRLRRPAPRHLSAIVRPWTGAGEARAVLALSDAGAEAAGAARRSDFVANASHELRTPLAAIRALVETLRGAAKDDPAAQARFLALIDEQGARMGRLVDDLLALSRVEMDENILPVERQAMGAVVDEALAVTAPLADEAGVAVEVWGAEALPKVRGSRDELVQVVVNLVENAIRHGGGSAVRVDCDVMGSEVRVAVRDEGPGIAAEHLPRLTERFYRVAGREGSGTGLGLAIVKHIVARHRGRLEIESEVGEGSVFRAVLPVA